jgi:hypothetical protein
MGPNTLFFGFSVSKFPLYCIAKIQEGNILFLGIQSVFNSCATKVEANAVNATFDRV